MTYNVFGGTLSLTQSINQSINKCLSKASVCDSKLVVISLSEGLETRHTNRQTDRQTHGQNEYNTRFAQHGQSACAIQCWYVFASIRTGNSILVNKAQLTETN